MLAVRKRHPVFGLGSFREVECDNPHILAFLRVLGDDVDGEQPETVLCVNNLSSIPQGGRICLPGLGGHALTDLFGGTGFPAIGTDDELTITMGSRDFFWLHVSPAPVEPEDGYVAESGEAAAVLQARKRAHSGS